MVALPSGVCGGRSLIGALPSSVLGLEHLQEQLFDVAGGHLVDVLDRHVTGTDLQLVLHGLNDPPGGQSSNRLNIIILN